MSQHSIGSWLCSIVFCSFIAAPSSAATRAQDPTGRQSRSESKDKAKGRQQSKETGTERDFDVPPVRQNPRPRQEPAPPAAPVSIDLMTDDGMKLAGTYYRSNLGVKAPAVMLLHGYGETRDVFNDLALALQATGCAVLTLDFRGHGQSVAAAARPAAAKTTKRKVPPDKLDFHDLGSPNMPYASLLADVQAAKRFLTDRNNAGELNLSKLRILGCEMGATITVLAAYNDWQQPYDRLLGIPRGDIDGLVLVSPAQNFKGVSIAKGLSDLHRKLAFTVVVGEDDATALNDAKRVYDAARRTKVDLPPNTKAVEVNVKTGQVVREVKLAFPNEFLKCNGAKQGSHLVRRSADDRDGAITISSERDGREIESRAPRGVIAELVGILRRDSYEPVDGIYNREWQQR